MRRLILFVGLLLSVSPAQAAVSIEFWSREFGNYFPHAFILLSGHPDNDPRSVDASYGFTATSVSPAILTGAVKGAVEPVPPTYLKGSSRHFTVVATDAQYARVRAVIDQWQALPQPSYDLHKRNCVQFAAAVARELGLRAEDDRKLVTKPRAFLEKVRQDNPVLGDGRGSVTAQQIAQANGVRLPAAPTVATRPAPATATQTGAAAARYAPQPALSAAAIAAGYRPDPSDR